MVGPTALSAGTLEEGLVLKSGLARAHAAPCIVNGRAVDPGQRSVVAGRARQQRGAGHRIGDVVVTAGRVVDDVAVGAARGATLESDELLN